MKLDSIVRLHDDVIDRDGRNMKAGTLVQVMAMHGSIEDGDWYTVASNPSFMGSRADVRPHRVTLVRE